MLLRRLLISFFAIVFSAASVSPAAANTNPPLNVDNQYVVSRDYPVSPIIPRGVWEKITRAQGILSVGIRMTSGAVYNLGSFASAFLVSSDGLIATALHLPPHVRGDTPAGLVFEFWIWPPEGGQITIPAELRAVSPLGDIALLKLASVPSWMRPLALSNATNAELVSRGVEVYAVLRGVLPFPIAEDVETYYEYDLPFSGRVVNAGSLLSKWYGEKVPLDIQWALLDRTVKPGFSGAAFVNKNGEVVGVGSFIDGGYTGISLASNIAGLIKSFREREQREREKK